MKICKSCETEVAKSAKTCPKCGAKLRMGTFPRIILICGALVVIAYSFKPSDRQVRVYQQNKLSAIERAQASKLTPYGELARIFNLVSDHTDLQRDNKEKEITGKVVRWRLEVYEVSKQEDSVYRIQTSAGSNVVGAFVRLHATNDIDRAKVEALKTGDVITVKGRITGTSLRHIDIENAIFVDN